MAEPFPPNPEDGELWLPSAIFSDVGLIAGDTRPSSYDLRAVAELGRFDEFVWQLASLELLDYDLRHVDRSRNQPVVGPRLLSASGHSLTVIAPTNRFARNNGARVSYGFRELESVFLPRSGTGVFFPRLDREIVMPSY